jgi:hypothetical protein
VLQGIVLAFTDTRRFSEQGPLEDSDYSQIAPLKSRERLLTRKTNPTTEMLIAMRADSNVRRPIVFRSLWLVQWKYAF